MPAEHSDTELRHGYTMASLDSLAKRAVFESRWQFLPFHEKHELAWSAIAQELYSCQDPPRVRDLIRVGERAIRRHVEDLGHLHGVYYYRSDAPYMARFEKYWWSQAAPTPSPEDRIIDQTALRQIWPHLNGVHQLVLTALATHGDYQRAAAALNKPYKTFVTQIYLARKQFLALWHEGEQPSKMWGRDIRRRVPSQRSVTATTIRRRRAKQRAEQPNTTDPTSSQTTPTT
jgi:hypothetical protein